MRIGINGRFLVANLTGVQRAAFNLVKTLIEIDRDNEYVIFTGETEANRPEWNYPNVRIVTSKIRRRESVRNHLWEQFVLPRLAKREKIDILHSPANLAPLFYTGTSIIHIHDLCFMVNPQWYSYSFRTLYNLIIPRLARKASHVTTNSNHSRNDLIQYCKLPSSHVSLIYWAVDQDFVQKENIPSSNIDVDDYILYVGTLEPRKNIKVLISAFEKMREQNPNLKTKLVLIGGESPLFADVRITINRYKDDVIFKGFVDDEELRSYYQKARLVAYPSLYEGFGLPPLEAMASGTPVVTSRTSSIPEVVGDAAITIDPRDESELADAMSRILLDENLRQRLIVKGRSQVTKFNWYRVARQMLNTYHKAYQKSARQPGSPHIPIEKWATLRQIEADNTLQG